MPEFKRSARVAEGVRMELSAILQDGLVRDPEVGFVTITDVVVTDDLRHAKVFVSVYGGASDKSLAALGRAAPFLRRELGPRLQLRYTPELDFVHDKSLEHGSRIDTLLKRIEKGDTNNLEIDPAPGALPVRTGREHDPLVVPPPPPEKKSAKKKRRGRR